MQIDSSDNEAPLWPTSANTSLQQCKTFEYNKPNKYIVSKKKLGDGSYSTVFECKNKVTGSHYAAKQYRKSLVYGLESMLQNEFHILKHISNSHPNILSLIDYFETADELYLVTDLALGGELFDRIVNHPNARLPENEATIITKTLITTVNFLHQNKIVHRDLKAENLLFQSKNSKNSSILVADFGCARIINNPNYDKLSDVCGTLSYIAPEMISPENNAGHGFPVDLWSIGVIVYFMLCGYMPFDCETDDETKHAICTGDYSFEPSEYWSHISQNAKDFIRCCFQINPDARLTTSQAMVHPFLNEVSNCSSASPSIKVTTPITPNSKDQSQPILVHSQLQLQRSSPSEINVTRKLKESVLALHHKQQQQAHSTQSKNYQFLQESSPSMSPSHSGESLLHTQNARQSLSPNKKDYATPSHSGMTSGLVSSMPSKLSLIEKSRSKSLVEGCLLQGDRCVSPELVSNFTTPIGSAAVSREQSSNEIPVLSQKRKDALDLKAEQNSARFFF